MMNTEDQVTDYEKKHHPDDIEYKDYEFKYCPNCGARIKRIEQKGV